MLKYLYKIFDVLFTSWCQIPEAKNLNIKKFRVELPKHYFLWIVYGK